MTLARRKKRPAQPAVWRPVVGWEGFYEVSDMGDVRSVRRKIVQRNGKVRIFPSRVLAQPVKLNGYASCALSKRGHERHVSVHRLVAEAFCDGAGPLVRHLDGNRLNNRADNLAWGTYEENEQDKLAHGRVLRGSDHWKAVIDEVKAARIRELAASGMGPSAIAAEVGCKRGVVYFVIKGETWRHV